MKKISPKKEKGDQSKEKIREYIIYYYVLYQEYIDLFPSELQTCKGKIVGMGGMDGHVLTELFRKAHEKSIEVGQKEVGLKEFLKFWIFDT